LSRDGIAHFFLQDTRKETRKGKVHGTRLAALGFAASLCLPCSQSVNALPVDGSALQEAAKAASPVQEAQFYERRARNYIIKRYREFFIGPYSCHRFHRWF
jgi:hypothetical protein